MPRMKTPATLLCVLLALFARPVNTATVNTIVGLEGCRLQETHALEGELHHVQGLDLDRRHVWVTSVDTPARKGYLHQFSRATWKLERRIDLTDGPRFHPGGFSVHGDSIWIPVAEYRPHSSAIVEEIDRRTLAVKRKIAVADHIGCVAVASEILIAGNWGSRQFRVLDFSGKQLRVIDNPESNQYQDIKFVDGLLVASGTFSHTSGAVDWFTWPAIQRIRRIRSGLTDRGVPYTAEGMTKVGHDLFLLPEDSPSRLFRFTLSP
jgi:hypothetical protein